MDFGREDYGDDNDDDMKDSLMKWKKEHLLGTCMLNVSQLIAPGNDIRARTLNESQLKRLTDSMRKDHTKKVTLSVLFRPTPPAWDKDPPPKNFFEVIKTAMDQGTLIDLNYPVEVICGEHRRNALLALGKEYPQVFFYQMVDCDVYICSQSHADARMALLLGRNDNYLEEERISTNFWQIIESYMRQYSHEKRANPRLTVNSFIKTNYAMFDAQTRHIKGAASEKGFGKSYLEVIISFVYLSTDRQLVLQRWFKPEVNRRGRPLWPLPKDLSIFVQNRNMQDEVVDLLRIHMGDSKKYPLTFIKRRLFEIKWQTRCVELFMGEYKVSTWDEFKKMHNLKDNKWLAKAVQHLDKRAHPLKKSSTIPPSIRRSFTNATAAAAQKSSIECRLNKVVIDSQIKVIVDADYKAVISNVFKEPNISTIFIDVMMLEFVSKSTIADEDFLSTVRAITSAMSPETKMDHMLVIRKSSSITEAVSRKLLDQLYVVQDLFVVHPSQSIVKGGQNTFDDHVDRYLLASKGMGIPNRSIIDKPAFVNYLIEQHNDRAKGANNRLLPIERSFFLTNKILQLQKASGQTAVCLGGGSCCDLDAFIANKMNVTYVSHDKKLVDELEHKILTFPADISILYFENCMKFTMTFKPFPANHPMEFVGSFRETEEGKKTSPAPNRKRKRN
eukprot:1364484-Amorphochlora_amoeboformis.AAC.1